MRPLPLAPGLGEFAVGVEVLEPPQLTMRKQQQRNKPKNCPIDCHCLDPSLGEAELYLKLGLFLRDL